MRTFISEVNNIRPTRNAGSIQRMVYSNWLKSRWKHPVVQAAHKDSWQNYYDAQLPVIDATFSKLDTTTLLLRDQEDPNFIYSWLVYSSPQQGLPTFIHYAYTRQGFRREGNLKQLLSFIGAAEPWYTPVHGCKYDGKVKEYGIRYSQLHLPSRAEAAL